MIPAHDQTNMKTDPLTKDRILFVDDESFILFSLRRFFRQNNIEVDVETDCFKAVELIRENKYKVIISDFKMPAMNGAQFLEVAKELSPESIRLVLSAYINQESLLEIVNKSEIYRYVTKPWRDQDLLSIIKESIEKYNRETSFQKSIEILPPAIQPISLKAPELPPDDYYSSILPRFQPKTEDSTKIYDLLRGEIHLHLTTILNLGSSKVAKHCKRVSELSFFLGKLCQIPDENLRHLYFASLYHDLGKIFELAAQAPHDEIGYNMLSQFDELKEAAKIVKGHHIHFQSEEGKSLSVETKILSIVDHFDKLVTKEFDKELDEKPKTLTEILAEMEVMKGIQFDPDIFVTFKDFIIKDFKLDSFVNEAKIHLTDIEEGMILSRPLFNVHGKVLLNSEYKLTKDVIQRIFKHHQIVPIKNPLYVYAKTPDKAFNFEEMILKKIKVSQF
jgi:response regulator RpfG family c-di-GMP phosphodiesterase